MKSGQSWKRIGGTLAAACLLFSGCGSGSKTKVTVLLNAPSLSLLVNQTFLFSTIVQGATDTSVTYKLTSVPTSSTNATPTDCSPGCGTLVGADKTSVTYQAPSVVPNPAQTITLTATSNADNRATATASIALSSGIVVTVTPNLATIGTGETFPFHVSLTNDSTPNDVNWSVKESNAGTVDATGSYTAPAAVPNPATATVVATSKLDPNQTGTALVTIVTAAAAAFTGISPTAAPLGGVFQDIYLQASNVRSTSTIRFNGIAVDPTAQIKVINSSVVRLRLNEVNLGASGTFRITIDNATETGGPFNVQINPVQPGLIAFGLPTSLANSILQNPNPGNLSLHGGFFGPGSGPVVTGRFNGDNPRVIQSSNSRQSTLNLSGGDLSEPGLLSASALNTTSGAVAASNFSVQPDPIATPPALVGAPISLKSSPTDTPAPTAIAVDTTLGIAIVSNTGNNTLQRLSFNGAAWVLLGGQIALPGSPNGIYVDEERHVAGVAVSTANGSVRNVTIVNLQTGAIPGTVDTSAVTPALPFAVGLDATTGLGIVAFSSTNIGAIFNFEPAASPACLFPGGTPPYCVTGVVSLSTGAKPQIAMHPRLRWAYVTPGGAGLMSVVDLGVPQRQAAIATAKRTSNVVTITTSTNHNLSAVNPGAVLISGVTDATFNGTFAVTSVIDAKTFTYSQTAGDASSSGGAVNFSNPLVTFTITSTITGIAINRQTGKAVLADPGSSFANVISTLDQTNISINAGDPSTGAAFQPFTNVAVVVKPGNVGATGVDRITLVDPTNASHITGQSQGVLAKIYTGGTNSVAVAVDPPSNAALVANNGSHDVSVISLAGAVLGAGVHAPQISEVRIPLAQRLFPQGTSISPGVAAAPLPIQIFGAGFTGTPTVRLDGVALAGAVVVSGREIDVTIPGPLLTLTGPHRYALDVVQGGTNFSNAADLTVVETVPVSVTGCAAPQPSAVAVDDVRDLAVVTNIACNNISIIDLNTGNLGAPITVGTAPFGVAVVPRLGLAAVTNSNVDITTGISKGAGSVSIVNLTTNAVTATPAVGAVPTGVAVNQDTGIAYVVNSGTNTVSGLDLTTATPTATTGATGLQPVSIAIDPDRKVAVVGALNATSGFGVGILDVIDISAGNPGTIKTTIGVSSLPTGVVFDPVNTLFYAVSSLGNNFVAINPDTGIGASVRVGVNPTSIAYNYHTGTLVTVNAGSNTLSFVDAQSFTTRLTIGFGTPPPPAPLNNPQFAVAIHARKNLAVIADAANNRVLLFPLP